MIKKSYLLVLLLLPVLVIAQNKLPANMFLHTLPNGLDVLVVEDNNVPLATVMMTFKAGAFTESENTNGLTGLYLNMLGKDNKDYTDFNYNAGGLGISSMNEVTNVEYGRFFFTLPKANIEDGLNFMNSAIRFATMDAKALEKEKEIVNDELKQKESGPYFALTETMFHHLWGNLYSRKNPIGNHDVILSATPASMDSIKNKYFYPNNALLIVGGDVDHDVVFRLVEKKYGDWKSSSFNPFKKWPTPEFKPLVKEDYFIVVSELSKSPYITIDWQGPDTRNDVPSTYAADVFSYIVNQKSSKLSTALVQSGLAFSVNINYLTLKHVGPISLTITPNPLKIRECMDEVKRQISLMDNDDYFTDGQIETAKRMLEINQVREEDITSDYVNTLSFWWASASLNYFLNYNDRLKKVSRADLKAYVSKYIKGKPYCAGLLISPDLKDQTKAETFFKTN